jgi:hypothetical protein
MFILKMENVGAEKQKVAFYDIQPVEDGNLLRRLVTSILDDKKNLQNEPIDTWRYYEHGDIYYYAGVNDEGYIAYKKQLDAPEKN